MAAGGVCATRKHPLTLYKALGHKSSPEWARTIQFVGEGDGPEAGKTGTDIC